MDELVKLVSSKVGISPEQAQQAVTTVIGFLKEKLPAGLGSQLDGLVGGGGAGAAGGAGGLDLGSVENAVGGLFGKK